MSPVTITVHRPSDVALPAMVAMMSSASMPVRSKRLMCMESRNDEMTGICAWRSSGVFSRLALYSP